MLRNTLVKLALAFSLGFALMGTLMAVRQALSTPAYPPIGYLASELGVGAGAQLPKGVVYNGRPFFFYIIGAKEHPNGRYTVELEAR